MYLKIDESWRWAMLSVNECVTSTNFSFFFVPIAFIIFVLYLILLFMDLPETFWKLNTVDFLQRQFTTVLWKTSCELNPLYRNESIGHHGINNAEIFMKWKSTSLNGFDWMKLSSKKGYDLVKVIKVFQSIIKGIQTISFADGKINTDSRQEGIFLTMHLNKWPCP